MKPHQAKVSECANPECKAEFRRLGEGKLFVQPASRRHQRQKAVWLCRICSQSLTMQFDEEQETFVLQKIGGAAA